MFDIHSHKRNANKTIEYLTPVRMAIKKIMTNAGGGKRECKLV
jgi:hypothetical protein